MLSTQLPGIASSGLTPGSTIQASPNSLLTERYEAAPWPQHIKHWTRIYSACQLARILDDWCMHARPPDLPRYAHTTSAERTEEHAQLQPDQREKVQAVTARARAARAKDRDGLPHDVEQPKEGAASGPFSIVARCAWCLLPLLPLLSCRRPARAARLSYKRTELPSRRAARP